MSSAPSNPSDPIFLVEVLRAHPGQCVLVHVGTVADPRLILVDGGPPGTWERELKPRLEELRLERGGILEIDAVISTRPNIDFMKGLQDFFVHIQANQNISYSRLMAIGPKFNIKNFIAFSESKDFVLGNDRRNRFAPKYVEISPKYTIGPLFHVNENTTATFYQGEQKRSENSSSARIRFFGCSVLIGSGIDLFRAIEDNMNGIDAIITRYAEVSINDMTSRNSSFDLGDSSSKTSIIFTDMINHKNKDDGVIMNQLRKQLPHSFNIIASLYTSRNGYISIDEYYKKRQILSRSIKLDVIKIQTSNEGLIEEQDEFSALVRYIMSLEDSILLDIARQMVMEGHAQPKALIQPTPQDFHAAVLEDATGGDIIEKLEALAGSGRRRTEVPNPLWRAWLRELKPETISRIRECLATAIVRRTDRPES